MSCSIGLLTASILLSTPAQAAPGDQTTHATGQFLLIQDLPAHAAAPPHAHADSDGDISAHLVPLSSGVFDGLDLAAGGVGLFGPSGVLTLGPVNQVALTPGGTSAVAASGAVSDEGELITGPGAALAMDIPISPTLLPAVTGVQLTAASIGARAGIVDTEWVGDYRISDLELGLNSPLVADIGTGLAG